MKVERRTPKLKNVKPNYFFEGEEVSVLVSRISYTKEQKCFLPSFVQYLLKLMILNSTDCLASHSSATRSSTEGLSA